MHKESSFSIKWEKSVTTSQMSSCNNEGQAKKNIRMTRMGWSSCLSCAPSLVVCSWLNTRWFSLNQNSADVSNFPLSPQLRANLFFGEDDLSSSTNQSEEVYLDLDVLSVNVQRLLTASLKEMNWLYCNVPAYCSRLSRSWQRQGSCSCPADHPGM